MAERVAYDEMGLFHENAEEFGLPWHGQPQVERTAVALDDGRSLSALRWGSGEPELVLLHGGAQNAHTWDTVAMALGRPLVAIDLPGHGHSDGWREGAVDVRSAAADVATAIDALAPQAACVVGMSMGGMTSIALVDQRPDLVRRHVLVDVLPAVKAEAVGAIHAFVAGPETFPDFAAILERTVQFNPTRSESSLRRGILHNAEQLEDGSWVWRHARHRGEQRPFDGELRTEAMWDALQRAAAPLLLVRGTRSSSVVDDAGVEELRRRRPDAQVEELDAGHSVQGDRPVELAALLDAFVPRPA